MREVRLGEIMAALSFASDLALGQPMEHALRTSVLAVQLARKAGLSRVEVRDCYFLALLRSLGCNAEADRVSAVFGDEQAVNGWLSPLLNGRQRDIFAAVVTRVAAEKPPMQRARAVARTLAKLPGLNAVAPAHCEVARLLAARLGFPTDIQSALDEVFERWDGKGVPRGLKRERVRRTVRVVSVARDVEIAAREHGVEGATALVKDRSGAALDPQVCEAFLSGAREICAALEVPSVRTAALELEPDASQPLEDTRLDDVLRAFGDLSDLRSRFTRGHSARLAELVAAAATQAGLPVEAVTQLRRAGWVHEVGMAAVPVSIVEKPGPLSDSDRERVRLHSYFTERILNVSPGLAELAELAGAAHEQVDARGYHRRLPKTALSTPARMLAVADRYVARCEERSYRKAFDPEEAARAIRGEATAGALDPEAVEAVLTAAGHVAQKRRPVTISGLTEREVAVLRLLARGLTNKEIAAQLGLVPKTVGNHLQNLFPKLGVTTRAGATMVAMKLGLLDPS